VLPIKQGVMLEFCFLPVSNGHVGGGIEEEGVDVVTGVLRANLEFLCLCPFWLKPMKTQALLNLFI
jgi:hypothetical protein